MPSSSVVKPPTGALLGYTDLGSFDWFGTFDQTETVSDLVFPESVRTYSAMRRDPQLAAVLAGITLPIRRATWAVDPAGCRPEVAQLVADDLGLPLMGVDDPGPARLRGLSWTDHLRTALLCIVYGFSGFELLADTSSGQARLVNAYQRTASTIVFIHASPNGDFGGITQNYHPELRRQAEIGPERMCWYAHEAEGSGWHGTSILRPGFSSWLIKQELRRVLAGSNRRWGMGVPTVRALPGTNPTDAQMSAAATLAQSARGGNTAGASLPPGFVMEILGLSGSAPNTIEALRWTDQQLSGMVLSRWMDLGSSQTGSRALGESFIDIFLLTLQSLADFIADTATRQIGARLVEWNWGTDEPVPRVVVSEVGGRHEVTADALNALMASGALSADPALEEWVRRTYRLPERDPAYPWQPPALRKGLSSGGIGGADGSVTDKMASVAASRRGRKRREVAGQEPLPIAAADGTQQDPQDQPDPQLHDQHQAAWTAALAALLAQWPDLSQPMVDDLATQAGQDVNTGNLAALGTLAVSTVVVAGLAGAIGAAMTGLAETGAKHVVAEAKKQGVKITAPADVGGQVDQVAQAIAGVLANGYSSAAARKALQVASGQATAEQVQQAVAQVLDGMGTADAGWVADNLGAALSAGQQAGRFAVFEAHPPKELVAREHHRDGNQCQPCTDVNGTRYATLAEAEADYPTAGAGYRACLGGLRCRGTVVGQW